MDHMVRHWLSSLLCGLAFGLGTVSAQWNLVQNASQQSPTCIRLTNAVANQRGAAWHDCQIHLGAAFDLEFTVNLGNNNGGADGICFVLQQAGNVGNNLVGNSGGSIGYTGGPFDPSLAIEIDTWQNNDVGDPSYDHIGISRDGANTHNLSAPVQAHVNNTNIETGQSYAFRVTWDPESNLLQAYFDGTLRKSLTMDLTSAIFGGDPLVYWGFTGTTGGATNIQTFCLVDAYYSTHLGLVEAAPDGPWLVCSNQELELTAAPIAPVVMAEWTSTGSDQIVVNAEGNYVLYGEDAEGCPTHNAIDVLAAPGPELQLLTEPDLLLCGATSATLSAAVVDGASIAWGGIDGADLSVTESGTYTVEAELGGCVQSESVNVLLQPLPEVSVELDGETVEGSIEVCFGEFITLETSATLGANATWQSSGTNSIQVNSSGDYYATASINGCESDPELLHVDLLPLPQAQITAFPNQLCWEGIGSIAAIPDPSTTVIDWLLPAGTTFLGQAGPGSYTALLSSDNGCENAVSFQYTMLPPIATGLVNPDPLCDAEVATLAVTGVVDNVTWNVGGTGNELNVVASMGEGPYVASVVLGQCTQSDTAWVTWWPTPSVGALPTSITRCVLDPATALNWPNQSNQPIGTWLWDVNGEPATAGYQIAEEGNYVIQVRDNATGCADTHELQVEVWPNLHLVSSVSDPLICIGDSTEVRVELEPVLGTDPYEIPFSITWMTEGASGWSNHLQGGEHQILATNACGTTSTLAQVEEEYCGCHIWIPNAFTPDDDGLNEGFRIVSSCEWDAFSFQIYNRWGQVVWATEDADQPWDGGAPLLGPGDHYLPDGWYPYLVTWEYQDDGIRYVERKTGQVLLIR